MLDERRYGVRPRTVVMVLAITIGALAVLTLGYMAWHAITWILIATFLAMALNPAVGVLCRRGLGRGLAATVVFFAAAVVFAGLGFLLVPPLVRETIEFVESVPGLIQDLDRGRGPFGFLEREFNLVDRAQKAIDEKGAGALLGFATPVVDVAKAVVSTMFGAVAIAFLTFFMLLDGPRWVAGFLDFVPDGSRPRWERIFSGVYRTVGGYVTGNLLISFVAGVVTGVTLFALGVPYAIPLGLLVAILDLIPLVGATIATVIVGLVSLTEGLVPAIIVVAILVAYQQFENHVLQPLVYGRSVQLSALAVLIAVLVGAELAGILGALAAIPVAGSLSVVVTELLRWRRDQMIETPPGAVLGPVEDETADTS
jgi:predicted PurR-regulated permease PerM